jgi:predicted amidohydrolase YtcJ
MKINFEFHFIRALTLCVLVVAIIAGSSCNHVKPGKMALINGKVYTLNPDMPWAEAVVVDSNTIVFVGSTADAKKYIGDSSKVTDLNGKMVLPGFVESHMHLALSNFMSQAVFLDANGTREQWLDVIRKTVKENPDKTYFLFSNFRPIIFGPEGPKKEDLDAIDSKRPIMVLDGSIHNAWVNSKAYELAGITRETPDPLPGGHYYKRDKQGNPSGFCVEAMSFVPIVMKLGITQEDIIGSMKQMFPMLSAYGFTTVFDAGSIMQTKMYEAFMQMEKEGNLPFRVFECYFVANPGEVAGAVDHLKEYDTVYRSHLLRVNTMKILLDGVLDARSCAMFDSFPDGQGNGFVLMPPDQLTDLVIKSDDAGFNIHIHGVGNRSISDALGAFEKLKEKKGFTPTRKTIAHNTFFMPNTVQRYIDLRDVVAQTTPGW